MAISICADVLFSNIHIWFSLISDSENENCISFICLFEKAKKKCNDSIKI